MGIRRGVPRADDKRVNVVLPDDPPVLTPQVAAALLRLLRNVQHNRGLGAQSPGESAAARMNDPDNGREAA